MLCKVELLLEWQENCQPNPGAVTSSSLTIHVTVFSIDFCLFYKNELKK